MLRELADEQRLLVVAETELDAQFGVAPCACRGIPGCGVFRTVQNERDGACFIPAGDHRVFRAVDGDPVGAVVPAVESEGKFIALEAVESGVDVQFRSETEVPFAVMFVPSEKLRVLNMISSALKSPWKFANSTMRSPET